jgi:hypothetical protein
VAIDVGSYLVVRQVGRAPLSPHACLVVRSCDSCVCSILDLGEKFYGFLVPMSTSGFSFVPRIEFWSADLKEIMSIGFPELKGWQIFVVSSGLYSVRIAFEVK